MDALLLQAVLRELAETVVGDVVTRVDLVGKTAILLRFSRERRPLFVSAHPELSRLSLVPEPPRLGAPRPAPDNLAEPLARARLASIEQEANGRVAALRFESPGARHEAPCLVAELIPRFANVLLVGREDRILWTLREFGDARRRDVAPGRRYAPPPPDPGVGLVGLDEAALRARIDAREGPRHLRIPRGWGGGSAGFARVLEEAGVDFVPRLLALAAAARDPRPRLARRAIGGEGAVAAGETLVLFPADPGELPGWEILPERSANETADRFHRPREEADADAALLADLRRVLARRRTRAAKALAHVQRRLAESESAEEVRAKAELLAASVGLLRRGQRRATLKGFDGVSEVAIELDPRLDAAANVEALFKKARRLARGREDLESQRSALDAEVASADRGLAALEPPPDSDALRALAREIAPALLDASPARAAAATAAAKPSAPRAPSLPEGFNPRRYVLPGGWEVWVGRNAKQNDELTHRWAAPRDLWFHARGCEGSHAVLRLASGKGEPPRAVIEAAAQIAAFHSKARHSKYVPVAWTERRHVRKPRGAPAGTASIQREKVVFVEPREPVPLDSAREGREGGQA
jgi:predicted ribosome quality control (RQC) complex YloA/Tae2 family protein